MGLTVHEIKMRCYLKKLNLFEYNWRILIYAQGWLFIRGGIWEITKDDANIPVLTRFLTYGAGTTYSATDLSSHTGADDKALIFTHLRN